MCKIWYVQLRRVLAVCGSIGAVYSVKFLYGCVGCGTAVAVHYIVVSYGDEGGVGSGSRGAERLGVACCGFVEFG